MRKLNLENKKKIYKTLTIKKVNRVTTSYHLRGKVKNPNFVLILKIGNNGGPVKLRKTSMEFISVMSKGLWGNLSQIGSFLKKMALYTFEGIVTILLVVSLEYELGEYSGFVPGAYLESILKTIDLSHGSIDLGIDMNDFHQAEVDASLEAMEWSIQEIFGLEKGEVPFIEDLFSLDFDLLENIPEDLTTKNGWLEFINNWLTEPSYCFDWQEYVFDLDVIESQSTTNSINDNIMINELAHLSNYGLGYEILDLDSSRFIITNESILNSDWLKSIRDLAVDISVEVVNGKSITTLVIDSEVANLLVETDLLSSSHSSELEYENAIRAIRHSSVVFSSPEFGELLGSINGDSALTILELSPSSSQEVGIDMAEHLKDIEWSNNMVAEWRERISILFSNQLPNVEPMPSWFEVPTRPLEPWAIEIWERDNEIRAMWTARLAEGYSQINIVTTNAADNYYSLNWFELGYQDAENLLGYNESETDFYSLEWFEQGFTDTQDLLGSHDIFQEEDLGLERLFNTDLN